MQLFIKGIQIHSKVRTLKSRIPSGKSIEKHWYIRLNQRLFNDYGLYESSLVAHSLLNPDKLYVSTFGPVHPYVRKVYRKSNQSNYAGPRGSQTIRT